MAVPKLNTFPPASHQFVPPAGESTGFWARDPAAIDCVPNTRPSGSINVTVYVAFPGAGVAGLSTTGLDVCCGTGTGVFVDFGFLLLSDFLSDVLPDFLSDLASDFLLDFLPDFLSEAEPELLPDFEPGLETVPSLPSESEAEPEPEPEP